MDAVKCVTSYFYFIIIKKIGTYFTSFCRTETSFTKLTRVSFKEVKTKYKNPINLIKKKKNYKRLPKTTNLPP
jgi:hypothetical protein